MMVSAVEKLNEFIVPVYIELNDTFYFLLLVMNDFFLFQIANILSRMFSPTYEKFRLGCSNPYLLFPICIYQLSAYHMLCAYSGLGSNLFDIGLHMISQILNFSIFGFYDNSCGEENV